MEHQEPTDPELEKVWDLLKSGKPVAPSPFFSRNVVREVRRLEAEAQSGSLARLAEFFSAPIFRPVAIGAAACVAFAIAALLISNPDKADPQSSAIAASAVEKVAFDPATEMAKVEFFGQLMAVTDPAILDDASIAELFF